MCATAIDTANMGVMTSRVKVVCVCGGLLGEYCERGGA